MDALKESRRNKIAVFLLVFLFMILFSSGRFGGDGLELYLTAESLFLDRDAKIFDRPFDVKEMKSSERGDRDAQGNFYASSGIGLSVLLVPFYAFGHAASRFVTSVPHDYITQFFVSWANPLFIALAALLLWSLLLRLGYRRSTALLVVCCYGFCSMTPAYARSGFSEPLLSLLVLSVFWCIFAFEKRRKVSLLGLAAFAIGYSLLIKKNSFLFLPPFIIYCFFKSLKLGRKIEAGKALGLVFAILFFFCMLYLFLYSRRGQAGLQGAGYIEKELVLAAIPESLRLLKGFFYYLLSPGKGFFFYNPALLLAFWGAGSLWKRNRLAAQYLIIFIAYYLLFYAYRFQRGSLFSWGPRYLFILIPLLCIFLAEFKERVGKRAAGRVLLCLCLLGFLIQLPSLFINSSDYLVFVKEGLGLPEYLINFMPELSPIRGSWLLFASAVKRAVLGKSSLFIYDPDPVFIQPLKASLSGFDSWDVWWMHAVKISPDSSAPVMLIVSLLCLGILGCFIYLSKTSRQEGRV